MFAPCSLSVVISSTVKTRIGCLNVIVVIAKAPPVDFFDWLPVGVNYKKTARGSVSLI